MLYLVIFLSLFVQQTDSIELKVIEQELINNPSPTHECHASTLLELDNGDILAAWFGGSYERHPDVGIYTSINSNGYWSYASLAANGIKNDTLRYPTWNPVLFRNIDSTIFLYYKIGPSPQDWWGAYKTTDNGVFWSDEKLLPPNVLGPIKNKAIRLGDGTILSPSSTETNGKWKAHIERSIDKAKSWEVIKIDSNSTYKAIQPTLISLNDSTIKAYFRSDQNVLLESYSYDKGKSWTNLERTDIANPNSGVDALRLADNNGFLLVYNPLKSGDNWWEGRSKLNVAFSKDGENWSDILILENQEKGEYSYPAIIQSEDGCIHISYTYNRKFIKYTKLQFINLD